ncbi:hypothetical protein NP493_965g01040 [Ridgeia piscesae]|uniref:Phospholysine phosphohistidine inorganic pyrophosphate phosphatase n=1 Tax=Ridgeia piscesae TaxID=27915 RepID=A0AAD9KIW8_RIDPI|nr:hypothetical protein NP493_965g01040 [Ridgeia piscesae]
MAKGPVGDWYKDARNTQGLLLDIFGVLYENGDEGPVVIPGSIEAVKKLKDAGIPVRFCTNNSTKTKAGLAKILLDLGFDVSESQLFPPPPAVSHVLKARNLRPYLIVMPDVLPQFADIAQTEPNCVVLGDAQTHFTYDNMNRAFQVLLSCPNPVLIAMGGGKYYQEAGEMKLDVGPFAKALEFASGIEAEIIGKPSKTFFLAALSDMGFSTDKVVMIGDDIISDVGGAQACGIRGVQVRTGKYRPRDEPHASVTPDGYVDNLLQAVDLFLAHR